MLNIEAFADSCELFDGHYALIRPLSVDGATADVWLALDTHTITKDVELSEVARYSDEKIEKLGLVVAIKIYRPQNALDIEGEQKFRDEYMIVFNCNHTNLIHPTHFSIFRETPYLVLPYCKLGSSEQIIGNLTHEKKIWKFLYDVASGLDYLHARCNPPIIHQDMKPANVLIVDRDNYAITDFGISAKYEKQQYSDDDDVSGTIAYMAPERFDTDYKPSPESDIWALGATLTELVTGRVPFGEEGGAGQSAGKKCVPFPEHLSRDIKKAITDCLNLKPGKRPTAKMLKDVAEEHLYSKKSKIKQLINFAVLLLICVGSVIIWLLLSGAEKETPDTNDIPVPDSILVKISLAQAVLRDGEQFMEEHKEEPLNTDGGIGEKYFIRAYQLFNEVNEIEKASNFNFPDSTKSVIDEGINKSEEKLVYYYIGLDTLSENPIFSEAAKKRIKEIETINPKIKKYE